MTQRILFSWIGFTDLRSMASSLPKGSQSELLNYMGAKSALDEPGPIKTLIENENFGACESCKRPIGVDRLRFQPEILLCVRCA